MGLIHVYCGDGKGKTTCALGLALRAAGAGMKVVIVQFLKGSETSELKSIAKIPNITLLRNTEDFGFTNTMTDKQLKAVKAMHNQNLIKVLDLVKNRECDLLVLDEITYVYKMNLADKSMISSLIKNKPDGLELVVTGRDPDKIFTDNADYITEMVSGRHPFEKGINARKGIEF